MPATTAAAIVSAMFNSPLASRIAARRSARTALAAAALLTAPAAAHADSILYIDGGNVWSAKPNGSAKIQLTDGGDWHSPTQADDGTFAAVKGTSDQISLFARDGRPLHTITTVATKSSDGGAFTPRPVDISLTPDGSRLAYTFVAYSCSIGSTCGTIERATMYTETNVTQATPQDQWGVQRGVGNPEWITNDRALVFGGYGLQMNIDQLGGGDRSFTTWLKPEPDLGDGELSRDMKRLVTTWDYGQNLILVFWAVNGDPRVDNPPPQPSEACHTGTDSALADPSWSADGTSIAYRNGDGITVERFTQFLPLSQGGCKVAGAATVLSPTGTQPDWGPADPPAARWDAGKPTPAPSPTPTPAPDLHRGAATLGVRVPNNHLRSALRLGLSVSVTDAVRGSVAVTARIGAKVLATGHAILRGGSPTTVRLTFTRAARRSLAGRKRVTLSLAAQQGTATGTATVTLRR